jgi:threonylcarbamoyladenosine tRNA methylthiotransferase MtaB
LVEARKRCAFFTLGCKVNQYDTEGLAEAFQKQGYEIVDFNSEADVYCINTCTVTHVADKKSRQAIRRAKRRNPKSIVVAIGCYAQVAPKVISSIPEVDVIVGTQGRAGIVDLVEQALTGEQELPLISVSPNTPRALFEEMPISCPIKRVRGFVKIQDGCNEFCAYCKVPYARGPSRSRKPGNIIEEVKRLVDSGVQEIVLTGVHIGAYGKDLSLQDDKIIPNLSWLLGKIHAIPGIGRIRLSSIEPLDIDECLINKIKELPKMALHFHIPLQSGDDKILEGMGRQYRTGDYRRIIQKIRTVIPEIAVTTDVMVGFPGESEENFINSYEFVKSLEFSGMHVFKFSRRPGTRAFHMKHQVNSKILNSRSKRMRQLAISLESEFCRALVGKNEEVLAEEFEPEKRMVTGIGSRYIRIRTPGEESLVGSLIPVKITEHYQAAVFAKRVLPHEEGFRIRN